MICFTCNNRNHFCVNLKLPLLCTDVMQRGSLSNGLSSDTDQVPKCSFFFFTVIGRGGEQINKLQSETGAKIQVAPGTEINFTVIMCM